MRKQAKLNKSFNVRLDEDKFYFPGERIRGTVAVFPSKPTRTNHIRVIFKGEISSLLKDKETITLFNKVKTLPISKDDEKSTKSHILEAKPHTFPFEFMVPEDIALPSSMEVFKQGRIRYTLLAIHDKPMVLEKMSPKATYNVPILEHIDISAPEYTRPTEKSLSTTLEGVEDRRKVAVKVNIPRYGYTRGDIVPLNISISHHSAFSREKGIKVEFVRVGQFSSNKQMVTSEFTLRTSESNINIYGPYNFSQSLTEQIMIPTSTPPTIDKKGKIIYINYKVRVTVNLNSKHSTKRKNIVTVELPIVVGTWPRAAVPIDEDDEWIEGMDDLMLSDEEIATGDNDSLYEYNTNEQNFVPDIQPGGVIPSPAGQVLHNQTSSLRNAAEWRLSTSSTSSSTSSATATKSNFPASTIDSGVIRSDSNASRISAKSVASVSSQNSSHSLESSQDTLTRNTSVSTTASAPEFPTAGVRYVRTTPVVPPPPPLPPVQAFNQPSSGLMKNHSNYIPRSSSTTDLTRPPNGQPMYMQQQPPYDAAGLYWRGPPPPPNDVMHDPRLYRGGRPPFNSIQDPSYSSMNGNMGYPPSNQSGSNNYANYGGSPGRHLRTPSDSSHMYHMQPNHPVAKYSPMPTIPDTQRTSQDDLGRSQYSLSNLPQFTPPRNYEGFHHQPAIPHRNSDPQTAHGPALHSPVMRSDSDPAAYSTKTEQATSTQPTPNGEEESKDKDAAEYQQTYGYYDSSDSSSDFGGHGDAAGSASEDSDDSADEGDLLRIVEKKRRQEQKEMKRRQRRVFTIAE